MNFTNLMQLLGTPSGGGGVAGCGDAQDPFAGDPSDPNFALKMQKLKMRALLEHVPHILSSLNATVNPVLANTAFAATATATIEVRISGIDACPSTAPFFTVSSITTGLCTIIMPGANVPLEAFTPNGRGNHTLDVGVWRPGTPLTAAGNNIDGNNHRLDLAIWCVRLDGEWAGLCSCC